MLVSEAKEKMKKLFFHLYLNLLKYLKMQLLIYVKQIFFEKNIMSISE